MLWLRFSTQTTEWKTWQVSSQIGANYPFKCRNKEKSTHVSAKSSIQSSHLLTLKTNKACNKMKSSCLKATIKIQMRDLASILTRREWLGVCKKRVESISTCHQQMETLTILMRIKDNQALSWTILIPKLTKLPKDSLTRSGKLDRTRKTSWITPILPCSTREEMTKMMMTRSHRTKVNAMKTKTIAFPIVKTSMATVWASFQNSMTQMTMNW